MARKNPAAVAAMTCRFRDCTREAYSKWTMCKRHYTAGGLRKHLKRKAQRKNPAAVALGRRGGKAKSAAKARASRENATKPRTAAHPCVNCGYGGRKTAGGFVCWRCGLRWK